MYRIGDFSKITGIPIQTLRYYDQIDLFKPDQIDIYTHYRYYSEIKIEELKTILNLKEIGFSLEEIKKYWNNFNNEILNQKKKELLNNIANTNEKIKKLDYLRSNLHDGKFIFEQNEFIKRKVKKLVNHQTIKIIKGSYDHLLFQRGNDLELINKFKNNKIEYYVIYKDKEIIDDFFIEKSDNTLDVNITNEDTIFLDYEIMKEVFKKISTEYNYITILIPNNLIKKIKLAIKYGFIEESYFNNKSKLRKIFKEEL